MELRSALSVCLISLFSATLVVLIARALDSQAAARLEPQLARIADQLEDLRMASGLSAAASTSTSAAPSSKSLRDGLIVYYFHGNQRCPTCRAIEAQSFEVVQTEYAAALDRGQLVWETLNYDNPSGKDLAKFFDVEAAVVVLAQVQDSHVTGSKRLDEVWALVDDKPAFARFLRDEIARMLPPSNAEASPASGAEPGEIPVPDQGNQDLPLPPDAETNSPAT